MKDLLKFITTCKGFDARTKLRLILLVTGQKPATYARIKISTNLHDKHRFEELLTTNGLRFIVDEPKTYEEIARVNKHTITWSVQGTWHGYDIFSDEPHQQLFNKYLALAEKGSMKQADLTAGKLYAYPSCCMNQFLKEQDTKYLKKTYTYYEYFKSREDLAHKFPFVMHTPCGATCKATAALNTAYGKSAKANAPKFYKTFTTPVQYKTKLIVDSHADIYVDDLMNQSAWLEKDGHQYQCISTTKLAGHYLALSYLQKNSLDIGTVFSAKVTIQHAYPRIEKQKITDYYHDVDHMRKLSGRKNIPTTSS